MIGDVEPVGLCGSGLVDAVRRARARRPAGRAPGGCSTREDRRASAPGLADAPASSWRAASASSCCTGPGPTAAPTAACSCRQRDVRELQFAKAAIATGWTPAAARSSASTRATSSRCCWRARFGSYLSPASAVRIGLVPTLPVTRIVSAGNVAGEGAKMVLLSVPRAARRAGAARGGRVRRALGPQRLQRPLRDQLAFPDPEVRRGDPQEGRRGRHRRRHRGLRAWPTTWPRAACATSWCSTRGRWSTPAAPRSTRPASSSRPTARACCARSRSARWISTRARQPERRTWLERRQPGGRGRAASACAELHRRRNHAEAYGLAGEVVRAGRAADAAAAARPGGDPRRLPRAQRRPLQGGHGLPRAAPRAAEALGASSTA